MKFIIHGGTKLRGDITVSGAKNSATPIIAATLLTDEECIIENVPRISDVDIMLRILQSIGSSVEWMSHHKLKICNRGVEVHTLDHKLVKSLRSSVLFLGSFLSRFHSVDFTEPGGCIIGNRPLDTHFHALARLGVLIDRVNSHYHFSHTGLKGATITLLEASVTATENLLMAASMAEGETVIKNAACEPHVEDLTHFLVKMGVTIHGIGTHTLTIQGVEKLHGTHHTLIPDTIEAGTFIIMGLASKSRLAINNVRSDHLDVVLEKLRAMGARIEVQGDTITTKPSALRATRVDTRPYPGVPTDLQSLFGVLATQAHGTSLIFDTMFEGRLGYIQELIRMGSNAVICDPHRVLITGPTPLYGQEIRSFDLRAGAAMIVAGIIAAGETVINGAEIIDRGYENIEERLRNLGVSIERLD